MPELGHTFGLRHCHDWRCVMASAHGVERLDAKTADSCAASHASLTRFAGEHAEFNRQWQAYKRELLYCDAVGETHQVHEHGTAVVQFLRRHMLREEAELLPLATKG